jgi:integrase
VIGTTSASTTALATEAAENGLLDRNLTQAITSFAGSRAANWLTWKKARDLLADPDTIAGKRDRAILGVLLGCALRRSELAALVEAHPAGRRPLGVRRPGGQGKRIRTVPIPPFVKVAIDAWTAAAG